MGIKVPVTVPQGLGAGVVRVAQMFGHSSPTAGTHVSDRTVDRQVRCVRLRSGRDSDHSLRKKQTRLGHADEGNSLRNTHTGIEHLGGCHTNLFGGGNHDTPRDEARVLPRLDHAS